MGSAYWRFCPDAQRLLRYSFSPDFPCPLFFSFSFSPFKVSKRSSSSPLRRRRKAHVLCLEIWTRALPSREGAVVWDGTGFLEASGLLGCPGGDLPATAGDPSHLRKQGPGASLSQEARPSHVFPTCSALCWSSEARGPKMRCFQSLPQLSCWG